MLIRGWQKEKKAWRMTLFYEPTAA